MKVNTDGVLLGAWLTITGTEGRILDVGTGTGVIALMAAQRFAECSQEPAESSQELGQEPAESGRKLVKCQIDAIDIDAASVEDAVGNFERSGFASSVLGLEARHISLQELAAETELKYDLIFSNPPYFINSLKSSDGQRSNARHTDTLGQGELLKCAMDLLAPEGRLAVVLPAAEGELLLQKIDFLRNRGVGGYALQPARLCRIHTTIKKPAKRWLMEFVYTQESLNLVESQLTIMSDGDYTAGYKSLTGDFYLNF